MPHNSQQPNKAEHHLPQQSVKYKHPVVKNNKNLLPLASARATSLYLWVLKEQKS